MTRRSGDAKLLAALVAAAALVRLALAILTEFRQIFPDYYFNDAVLYDAFARKILAAWTTGDTKNFMSPGTEAFALMTGALYKLFGPLPMAVKLTNALLGVGACIGTAWAAASIAGRRAGVLALGLAALWPSHCFYTSQAFKEAPSLLLLSGALGCICAALSVRTAGRRALLCAAGSACIIALGFFRPHIVPFLALAGATGAAALLYRRGSRALPEALCIFLFTTGGAVLYKPCKIALEPVMFGYQNREADFLPAVENIETPQESIYPDSPRRITRYRQARQYGNRFGARISAGREVETELFPNETFDSWLDVALFLPKASFYELFMPLPGLYPMAGKLGRKLSAAENMIILFGVFSAAWGFWTLRRRPAAWALAAFFLTLTPAAALFEFDLGSASRHRLQPLCAALPLAAAHLTARYRRRT